MSFFFFNSQRFPEKISHIYNQRQRKKDTNPEQVERQVRKEQIL